MHSPHYYFTPHLVPFPIFTLLILPRRRDDYNKMTMLRRLAVIITLQCVSVIQLYLYFGGTSYGRHWFRDISSVIIGKDDNANGGGLILLMLAIPILISGAACTLLLINNKGKQRIRNDNTKVSAEDATSLLLADAVVVPRGFDDDEDNLVQAKNVTLLNDKAAKQLSFISSSIKRYCTRGLLRPRPFALAFGILPCMIFFTCSIHRHKQAAVLSYPTLESAVDASNHYSYNSANSSDTTNTYIEISNWRRTLTLHIANDSAILSLVAFAHLLIPVSKHSPLVTLLKWSPSEAIVVHKYAGRLAIFGVVLHGGLHLVCGYWRWWNAFMLNDANDARDSSWMKRSFWYGYIPPVSCWKNVLYRSSSDNEYDFEPNFGEGCIHDGSPCKCYDFFVNLTGLLGLVALLILLFSSVGYVRRHFYRVFYV